MTAKSVELKLYNVFHTGQSVEAVVAPGKTQHITYLENPMPLQLTVPSMACSACVDTITKAVQSVDADAKVAADPKTKKVEVETNTAETKIREAIAQAGYPVQS